VTGVVVKREERLADLLALLLHTTRPLTVGEIVASVAGYPPEFDSARVQFERDKAALRDDGAVIEESPDGGYRIDPSTYELPDLGLTDDEAVALNLAVSAVRIEGAAADATAAMWKLGLSGDASPPLVALASTPALVPLQRALSVGATASFTYHGVDRIVEPYGLLLREGWWYLVAFDRVRGARRNFRLDRIDGDVVVGATAGEVVVPEDVDLEAELPDEAFELGSGSGIEARVRVDGVLAARVVHEVGEQRVVEWFGDGSVELALIVTHEPGFLSWVLGLLDHATVLSPPSLVAFVVEHLEAMAR
jgi:predicted DNA-binding transcriptional regulator YafY